MTLRSVPIHRVGNRHVLFMGGERNWVMITGLLSGVMLFSVMEWYSIVVGLLMWFSMIFALRQMAKNDPIKSKVYFRSLIYRGYTVINPDTGKRIRGYFPPRSTPYRVNSTGQGRRYK
jgi:type IV secretion system protein VirB3